MVHVVDLLTENERAPEGKKCTITMAGEAFILSAADEPIATCTSPERLSDFAFKHGATEVRHTYDGSKIPSDSIRVK